MGFWTDRTDPKRKFNFEVDISDAELMMKKYYAKSVTKPSFTVNAAEHNYLNHTFYYPGRVTWNDVSITFVDPGGEDSASGGLAMMLRNMGYNPPGGPEDNVTISKSNAVDAMGSVKISQLDEEGNVLDTWTLLNAWLMEVNFGELDYTSDDLVEVTCTIKYDFAKLDDTLAFADTLFDPATVR
tara:strand:- start:1812 stop:2363 length:552 start_codon:yes stop_codon:yes gene_type:complete